MLDRYPDNHTLKIEKKVQMTNAGYIRKILFLTYSGRNELFSKDLLIKKPLTKKNIGTPGKYFRKPTQFKNSDSIFKWDTACHTATCNAANNRIKLKLFALKKLSFMSYYFSVLRNPKKQTTNNTT